MGGVRRWLFLLLSVSVSLIVREGGPWFILTIQIVRVRHFIRGPPIFKFFLISGLFFDAQRYLNINSDTFSWLHL